MHFPHFQQNKTSRQQKGSNSTNMFAASTRFSIYMQLYGACQADVSDGGDIVTYFTFYAYYTFFSYYAYYADVFDGGDVITCNFPCSLAATDC